MTNNFVNKALLWDGNKLETVTWANDSYKFLSKCVSGYIERIENACLEKRGIDAWCNEEGKFNSELEPTLGLSSNGSIYDVVVGNVVFTRFNDEGETISLTNDDIKYVKHLLNNENSTFCIYGTKVLPCLNYDEGGC